MHTCVYIHIHTIITHTGILQEELRTVLPKFLLKCHELLLYPVMY